MKRPHRSAHRSIWIVLAVLIPATLLAGLALRQPVDAEVPPERLGPPTTDGQDG